MSDFIKSLKKTFASEAGECFPTKRVSSFFKHCVGGLEIKESEQKNETV
jgi:hypothetical protein